MQPCSIPNFLLTDKADITNSSHIKTSNFHMAQLSGPYNDEAIKLLFYFQSLSDMQSLLLIKMVKHLLQSYYFDFSFQQYYITFKSVMALNVQPQLSNWVRECFPNHVLFYFIFSILALMSQSSKLIQNARARKLGTCSLNHWSYQSKKNHTTISHLLSRTQLFWFS